jgi:hypothetical protein
VSAQGAVYEVDDLCVCSTILIGDSQCVVSLWDVRTERVRGRLRALRGAPLSSAFHAEMPLLAVVGLDRFCRVYRSPAADNEAGIARAASALRAPVASVHLKQRLKCVLMRGGAEPVPAPRALVRTDSDRSAADTTWTDVDADDGDGNDDVWSSMPTANERVKTETVDDADQSDVAANDDDENNDFGDNVDDENDDENDDDDDDDDDNDDSDSDDDDVVDNANTYVHLDKTHSASSSRKPSTVSRAAKKFKSH